MQLSPALVSSGWVNLYNGDEVGVAFRDNRSGENLVITFDYLSGSGHGREKIDGESLFRSIGHDHMHFPASKAAWYQSPETQTALVAAHRVASTYKQVILYGGSQGGYAALLFSGPLCATKVIAFAPQFSVDPTKAPFECRFDGFVREINFVYDDMLASVSPTADKFVLYDPYHAADRMHVELMRGIPNLREIRLPFTGHYPASVFAEMGVLKSAAGHLILDPDPNPAMQRLRRTGRGRSARYMMEVGSLLTRRGRFRDAIKAINAAYVLTPNSITVVEAYFAALQGDGIWTGLSLALLRLIRKEHPEWSQYDGAQATLWHQLVTIDALRSSHKMKQPAAIDEPVVVPPSQAG